MQEILTDPGTGYWDRTWGRMLKHQAMIAPSGKLMQLMLPFLPRGAQVLDLGCGEGRNTLYLARIGYQAIGLDISRKGVTALANNLFEEDVQAGVLVGDAGSIPLRDGSLHGILAHNLFDHVGRDLFHTALASCWRVLVPGGILLMTLDAAAAIEHDPPTHYVGRDDHAVIFVKGPKRGLLFRPYRDEELRELPALGWEIRRQEMSPRRAVILLLQKPNPTAAPPREQLQSR